MDFRADNFIWAVEADSICIRVSMIDFNCKHVSGDGSMALGSYAEKGHRVAVAAHGDVGRKFVQVHYTRRDGGGGNEHVGVYSRCLTGACANEGGI